MAATNSKTMIYGFGKLQVETEMFATSGKCRNGQSALQVGMIRNWTGMHIDVIARRCYKEYISE